MGIRPPGAHPPKNPSSQLNIPIYLPSVLMKTTLCHSDDGESRVVHPMQHIIHVRREGVNRYREQLACDLCHATWWIEYPHLKSLPNEMDTLWQDEGGEG